MTSEHAFWHPAGWSPTNFLLEWITGYWADKGSEKADHSVSENFSSRVPKERQSSRDPKERQTLHHGSQRQTLKQESQGKTDTALKAKHANVSICRLDTVVVVQQSCKTRTSAGRSLLGLLFMNEEQKTVGFWHTMHAGHVQDIADTGCYHRGLYFCNFPESAFD